MLVEEVGFAGRVAEVAAAAVIAGVAAILAVKAGAGRPQAVLATAAVAVWGGGGALGATVAAGGAIAGVAVGLGGLNPVGLMYPVGG